MNTSKSTLSVIELALTIALPIIGGQIAETTQLSLSTLVFLVVVVLVSLIAVRQRQEAIENKDAQSLSSTQGADSQFIAAGAISGLLCAWLFIMLLGVEGSVSKSGAHLYEWVSIFVGAALALTVAWLRTEDRGYWFAIGYAVGLPALVLFLRPTENVASDTWAGNFIGVMFFSFIAITVKREIFGR